MKRTSKWILAVMMILAVMVFAISAAGAEPERKLRTKMPALKDLQPRRGVTVSGPKTGTEGETLTFTLNGTSDGTSYVIAVAVDDEPGEPMDTMYVSAPSEDQTFSYTFYTHGDYCLFVYRYNPDDPQYVEHMDSSSYDYFQIYYDEIVISPGTDGNALTEAVASAAAECRVRDATDPSIIDEFETAVAINDWLAAHVTYDYSYTYYSPEAALLYGTGVCNSYSRAYKMIADEIGLGCKRVTGYGGGEGHAWNAVEIDGEWYQVDPTWNDGSGAAFRHVYMGLNDTLMELGHSSFHYPNSEAVTCDSLEDNYFVHTGRWTDLVSGSAAGEASVMEQLQNALDEGVLTDNEITITADFGDEVWLEGGSRMLEPSDSIRGINGTVAAYALSRTTMIHTDGENETPMQGTFTYEPTANTLTGTMHPAEGTISTVSGTAANLTWTLDNGVLTISGRGAMNSTPWSPYAEEVTRVIIREGITTVCDNAFAGCVNMTEAFIPASMETISLSAFPNEVPLQSLYYGGLREDWNSGRIYSWGSTWSAIDGCSDLQFRSVASVPEDRTITVSATGADGEPLALTREGDSYTGETETNQYVTFIASAQDMEGYSLTYRFYELWDYGDEDLYRELIQKKNPDQNGQASFTHLLRPGISDSLSGTAFSAIYMPEDENEPILVCTADVSISLTNSNGTTGIGMAVPGYYVMADEPEGAGCDLTITIPDEFPVEKIGYWYLGVYDQNWDIIYEIEEKKPEGAISLQTGTNTIRIPQSELEEMKDYHVSIWLFASGYDMYTENGSFITVAEPTDGTPITLTLTENGSVPQTVYAGADYTLSVTADSSITALSIWDGRNWVFREGNSAEISIRFAQGGEAYLAAYGTTTALPEGEYDTGDLDWTIISTPVSVQVSSEGPLDEPELNSDQDYYTYGDDLGIIVRKVENAEHYILKLEYQNDDTGEYTEIYTDTAEAAEFGEDDTYTFRIPANRVAGSQNDNYEIEVTCYARGYGESSGNTFIYMNRINPDIMMNAPGVYILTEESTGYVFTISASEDVSSSVNISRTIQVTDNNSGENVYSETGNGWEESFVIPKENLTGGHQYTIYTEIITGGWYWGFSDARSFIAVNDPGENPPITITLTDSQGNIPETVLAGEEYQIHVRAGNDVTALRLWNGRHWATYNTGNTIDIRQYFDAGSWLLAAFGTTEKDFDSTVPGFNWNGLQWTEASNVLTVTAIHYGPLEDPIVILDKTAVEPETEPEYTRGETMTVTVHAVDGATQYNVTVLRENDEDDYDSVYHDVKISDMSGEGNITFTVPTWHMAAGEYILYVSCHAAGYEDGVSDEAAFRVTEGENIPRTGLIITPDPEDCWVNQSISFYAYDLDADYLEIRIINENGGNLVDSYGTELQDGYLEWGYYGLGAGTYNVSVYADGASEAVDTAVLTVQTHGTLNETVYTSVPPYIQTGEDLNISFSTVENAERYTVWLYEGNDGDDDPYDYVRSWDVYTDNTTTVNLRIDQQYLSRPGSYMIQTSAYAAGWNGSPVQNAYILVLAPEDPESPVVLTLLDDDGQETEQTEWTSVDTIRARINAGSGATAVRFWNGGYTWTEYTPDENGICEPMGIGYSGGAYVLAAQAMYSGDTTWSATSNVIVIHVTEVELGEPIIPDGFSGGTVTRGEMLEIPVTLGEHATWAAADIYAGGDTTGDIVASGQWDGAGHIYVPTWKLGTGTYTARIINRADRYPEKYVDVTFAVDGANWAEPEAAVWQMSASTVCVGEPVTVSVYYPGAQSLRIQPVVNWSYGEGMMYSEGDTLTFTHCFGHAGNGIFILWKDQEEAWNNASDSLTIGYPETASKPVFKINEKIATEVTIPAHTDCEIRVEWTDARVYRAYIVDSNNVTTEYSGAEQGNPVFLIPVMEPGDYTVYVVGYSWTEEGNEPELIPSNGTSSDAVTLHVSEAPMVCVTDYGCYDNGTGMYIIHIRSSNEFKNYLSVCLRNTAGATGMRFHTGDAITELHKSPVWDEPYQWGTDHSSFSTEVSYRQSTWDYDNQMDIPYEVYFEVCFDDDPDSPNAVWTETNRISIICHSQGRVDAPTIPTAEGESASYTVARGDLLVIEEIRKDTPCENRVTVELVKRENNGDSTTVACSKQVYEGTYGPAIIPTWGVAPGTYDLVLTSEQSGYDSNITVYENAVTVTGENTDPYTDIQWAMPNEVWIGDRIDGIVYVPGAQSIILRKTDPDGTDSDIYPEVHGETGYFSTGCAKAGVTTFTVSAWADTARTQAITLPNNTYTANVQSYGPIPVTLTVSPTFSGDTLTYGITIGEGAPEGTQYRISLSGKNIDYGYTYEIYGNTIGDADPETGLYALPSDAVTNMPEGEKCELKLTATYEKYDETTVIKPVIKLPATAEGETHTVTLTIPESGETLRAYQMTEVDILAPGATEIQFYNESNRWDVIGESGDRAILFTRWLEAGDVIAIARARWDNDIWIYSNPVILHINEGVSLGTPQAEFSNGNSTARGTDLAMTLIQTEHAEDYLIQVISRDSWGSETQYYNFTLTAADMEEIPDSSGTGSLYGKQLSLPTGMLTPGDYLVCINCQAQGYDYSDAEYSFTVTEGNTPEGVTLTCNKNKAATGETVLLMAYAPGAEKITLYRANGYGNIEDAWEWDSVWGDMKTCTYRESYSETSRIFAVAQYSDTDPDTGEPRRERSDVLTIRIEAPKGQIDENAIGTGLGKHILTAGEALTVYTGEADTGTNYVVQVNDVVQINDTESERIRIFYRQDNQPIRASIPAQMLTAGHTYEVSISIQAIGYEFYYNNFYAFIIPGTEEDFIISIDGETEEAELETYTNYTLDVNAPEGTNEIEIRNIYDNWENYSSESFEQGIPLGPYGDPGITKQIVARYMDNKGEYRYSNIIQVTTVLKNCDHSSEDTYTSTEWVGTPTITDIAEDNIYHRLSGSKATYVICSDCHQIIESSVEENVIENEGHNYDNGVCTICGHANTCSHVHTTTQMYVYDWSSATIKADEDNYTHMVTGAGYEETRCEDCGMQVSREEKEQVTVRGSHSYDGEHICTECGHECTHHFDENGYCDACWYYCQHDGPEYTEEQTRTEYNVLKDTGDGEHHEVYESCTVTYRECAECGHTEEIGREYSGLPLSTEEHSYTHQGRCACGAWCQHAGLENGETREYPRDGTAWFSIDEEYHIEGMYKDIYKICPVCGQEAYYDRVLIQTVGEQERHSYDSNGYCNACGYNCPHTHYTDGICDVCEYVCEHNYSKNYVYEWGENTQINSLGNNGHHIEGTRICSEICDGCGTILSTTEESYISDEVHTYYDQEAGEGAAKCSLCGHTNNCIHESTYECSQWEGEIQFTDTGSNKTHEVTGNLLLYDRCNDCGMRLNVRMEENYTETQGHSYDENGICGQCNHVNSCTHEHPEVQNGFNDWGNTGFSDDGDNYGHLVTGPGWEGTWCPDCGTWIADPYDVTVTKRIGHDYSGTTCTICGHTCTHNFNTDGFCDACGYQCPHTHYTDGKCDICPHMFQDEISTLNTLTLPAFLTMIEEEAFMGGAFQVVIIPDSCTHIRPRAFANCGSLMYISYPAGCEIDESAFDNWDYLIKNVRTGSAPR